MCCEWAAPRPQIAASQQILLGPRRGPFAAQGCSYRGLHMQSVLLGKGLFGIPAAAQRRYQLHTGYQAPL
ncbi:hypothetical protein GLGCALEP_02822 [Pseudomonas sp. MM221]|nr:hypothetical protein GLGCALEP_02822 [Pseudomonas sp. MM221]